VDFRLAYPTEKTGLQINETSAMSAIVLSIASHADHLNHLIKTSGGQTKLIEIEALKQRTERLPASVTLVDSRLKRVLDACQVTNERSQKYTAAFKHANTTFKALISFGADVRQTIQHLDELEANFEERRTTVSFLFEELGNLAMWYDLFNTSYDELLVEIDRRHAEHKRMEDIMQAYQKDLDLWWEVENQKRENFYQYYGRYLPQSLCPSIMERAVRLEIFPAQIATNLPSLTHDMQRLSEPPATTTITITLPTSSPDHTSD